MGWGSYVGIVWGMRAGDPGWAAVDAVPDAPVAFAESDAAAPVSLLDEFAESDAAVDARFAQGYEGEPPWAGCFVAVSEEGLADERGCAALGRRTLDLAEIETARAPAVAAARARFIIFQDFCFARGVAVAGRLLLVAEWD